MPLPSSGPFASSACAKSTQPYHQLCLTALGETCMDIDERFLVFATAASLMVIAATVLFILG